VEGPEGNGSFESHRYRLEKYIKNGFKFEKLEEEKCIRMGQETVKWRCLAGVVMNSRFQ
jgi:hypothetical protein